MEKQKLAQKQREIERLKKTVEKLNQVIAERNDRIAELEVLLYGEVQDDGVGGDAPSGQRPAG